ncbi:MAG: DUF4399 domain-containing protein [Candidatus Thiodiazotropha sp. (ex Codakia rugifera)]|nr:DUF4399 domain-containing protein [Candidatus Thiodiazotropha sp. (ex Codakia rugifera)]
MPVKIKHIPRDTWHIYYGQGEAEAILEWVPGRHTLQLLLGAETHEPHNHLSYRKG